MTGKFWFILTLQIAAVFFVAISMSFIGDYFHGFFGDYFHKIPEKCWIGAVYEANEPHWHWGYRHVLWCFMGVFIFLVQVFRIGVFIYREAQSKH